MWVVKSRTCIAHAALQHVPQVRLLLVLSMLLGAAVNAAQVDIAGPAGSGEFGHSVTVLPNGNIVVTDPYFDAPGPILNVGAAYLYSSDGMLISSLYGSTADDRVGEGGVTLLSNGNYLVGSSPWSNGTMANAGALTWGDQDTGVSGVVSGANSLVGSAANDFVGSAIALRNGHYVAISSQWDRGAISNAGAATWGNGDTGTSGALSGANSLVGSNADDQVGTRAFALRNGNYVVASSYFNGGIGAATWGSGTLGVVGEVSVDNSLLGSPDNQNTVVALSNGNYVVVNSGWGDDVVQSAGAVTWGNGSIGTTGVVSSANSLVGTVFVDSVGSGGVTALSNGNYVVRSPRWRDELGVSVGSVTWSNGDTGSVGAVSSVNSLVGSTGTDFIGSGGVTALRNGNYVVVSPEWNNGVLNNAGAVTWGNGSSGTVGVVASTNSLIGSTDLDLVGSQGVVALSNGNYVVTSPYWNNGAIPGVGAVTWSSGSSGISGPVTAANSLVGSQPFDSIGYLDFGRKVAALSNGHYVVASQFWDNGAITDAGAVTWGNGNSGSFGAITPANSLVGGSTNDQLGKPDVFGGGVVALTNGDYVFASPFWDRAAVTNAGAVTWGNGTHGSSGLLTDINSMMGSVASDRIGGAGIIALRNGHYAVHSTIWNNAGIVNGGAVSLGYSDGTVVGDLSPANSVVGTVADGGYSMSSGYDVVSNQLVVGRPLSNLVSLFRPDVLPSFIFGDGLEAIQQVSAD